MEQVCVILDNNCQTLLDKHFLFLQVWAEEWVAAWVELQEEWAEGWVEEWAEWIQWAVWEVWVETEVQV